MTEVFRKLSRPRPRDDETHTDGDAGVVIERMALVDALDDEPIYNPDRDTDPPPRFPFRVAWRVVSIDGEPDEGGEWRVSCRGKDAVDGSPGIGSGDEVDALRWLHGEIDIDEDGFVVVYR